MPMAANDSTQKQTALLEQAPDQPTKAASGVTLQLPRVGEDVLEDEEELGVSILPSISLPRLPSVSGKGLLTSGKYAVVPARKAAAGDVVLVRAGHMPDRPTALLLIPGR